MIVFVVSETRSLLIIIPSYLLLIFLLNWVILIVWKAVFVDDDCLGSTK